MANEREQVSDRTLVERAQTGDKAAFDLLVVKYYSRLSRLLSRFVRRTDEIEDLVQETFIKAYRALPNFRNDSAFYTWIYRIAVNTAKNYFASMSRQIPAFSDMSTEDPTQLETLPLMQDVSTPEHLMMTKEIMHTVSDTIESLPNELRTAIVLREIEGLSYEEIAEAMDCPVGTVRSRIFRAREAVAARLKPMIDGQKDRRW